MIEAEEVLKNLSASDIIEMDIMVLIELENKRIEEIGRGAR